MSHTLTQMGLDLNTAQDAAYRWRRREAFALSAMEQLLRVLCEACEPKSITADAATRLAAAAYEIADAMLLRSEMKSKVSHDKPGMGDLP